MAFLRQLSSIFRGTAVAPSIRQEDSMFDLITEPSARPLRERSPMSKVVAVIAHAAIVAVVLVIPLLQAANQLPPVVPTMLAFVAAVPAAPPPPPPPPSAAVAGARHSEPASTTGDFAAPLTAPAEIQPDQAHANADATAGVLGGVEGGVPGGIVGGLVGGLVPPPPPPPAPLPSPTVAPPAPVRIGGQIMAPALLHRVEPIYPDVAAAANVTGIVILEAVIDTEGCVASVKVLRSRHTLLDKASEHALLQWRYSPLVLNGIPTPFVLTVTFNFSTS
jgi:protein TonB